MRTYSAGPGSPSDGGLPTPVQLSTRRRSRGQQQKTRFSKERTKGFCTAAFDKIRRKFGSGPSPEASSVDGDSESVGDGNEIYGSWWGASQARALEEAEEIDEVVVDRDWGEDFKSSSPSEHGGEKGGGGYNAVGGGGGGTAAVPVGTDGGSERSAASVGRGFWASFLRWKVWPVVLDFFEMQFSDQRAECQYKKENWYVRKVRFAYS